MVALSGGDQSVEAHQTFPRPLVALVNDGSGHPVPGVKVTFALPRHDDPTDDVTFADGSTTATIATAEDGTATSSTLYADRPIGTFTATGTVAGAAGAAWALSVTKPKLAQADLDVSLRVEGKVKRGHRLEIGVSGYDNGPDPADYITIRVTLPHGWRVTEAGQGHRISSHVVEFTVATSDPGADSNFTLAVKAGRHRGKHTVKATVRAGTPDPKQDNDTVKERVKVT